MEYRRILEPLANHKVRYQQTRGVRSIALFITNNQIYVTGRDRTSKFGTWKPPGFLPFRPEKENEMITHVCCSTVSSIIITDNRNIYCLGSSKTFFDDDKETNQIRFTCPSDVVTVTCGSDHAVLLLSDGDVLVGGSDFSLKGIDVKILGMGFHSLRAHYKVLQSEQFVFAKAVLSKSYFCTASNKLYEAVRVRTNSNTSDSSLELMNIDLRTKVVDITTHSEGEIRRAFISTTRSEIQPLVIFCIYKHWVTTGRHSVK